jgi:hypothetical protein
MARVLSVPALLVAFAAAVAGQPAPGEKEGKEVKFRIFTDARLTMTVGGKEQKVHADADAHYSWTTEGKTRTLALESLRARAVVEGKEVMDTKMSRAGMFGTAQGKSIDLRFEDAPEARKRQLTDSFGSPLCKIELDESGNETKRTVVAGPGASVVIDTGTVANCTLFHPRYAADADEWRSDAEVSIGHGLAKGTLTYKKSPGGKGGKQTVKVTGTLAADGVKLPGGGGVVVDEGRYAVKGEQTYDPDRREWVAGRLAMDVSFKLTRNGQDLGTAKGTLTATFEVVEGRKK